jgi:ribosomal protein S18 acetylase RimI-like enzyme
VGVVIRPMRDGDVDAIVALSLRAWEPVFASIHETVGPKIFDYFYGGDWRGHQTSDVRRACSAYQVSVAEVDGRVVGFTAVDLPPEGVEGEIYMVAVDPDAQGAGVGTHLTVAAVEDIRRAGKRAAVVETGGDSAHAPARATYHKAGFTPFPSERFYLLLDGVRDEVDATSLGER